MFQRKPTQKSEQDHEEQALFQAFLNVCPGFVNEEVSEWSLAECDPPDVICITTSGRRVGVEICQWAHEREMREWKGREAKERKLLDAIGVPQPMNTSKNFQLAVFFPRDKVYITPSEYTAFQKSFLRLIKDVDLAWPTEHRGPTYRSAHLNRFPPLNKFLEQVKFVPGKAFASDVDWIIPVGYANSFDDRTMADPLLEQIAKKKKRCRALKSDCDELHLLIAYDQALSYCSPIGAPNYGVSKIANDASAALWADRGPFSSAFLFIAVEPGFKVFRLL